MTLSTHGRAGPVARVGVTRPCGRATRAGSERGDVILKEAVRGALVAADT